MSASPLGCGWEFSSGIAWSWVRYAIAYAVLFGAGEIAWNRFAYSPRLTPIDQGLTMAILLLPVAGMGVTLELFLSDDPEGRWAPWRAAPRGRVSPEDRRSTKPAKPEDLS